MGFLVDTAIWVAVDRGQIGVADIHAITQAEPIFISPVNIAEMQMGLELISDPHRRQKALVTLRRIKRKPIMRIDGTTGEVFGSIAAQLRQAGRGHEFRVQDLWLAAQAIQRKFKLLTSNEKDFRDVPGLDLVVLRI